MYTQQFLKSFAWADQRAKVCFIFHKAQLRFQKCFVEQEQCFMKLQSLIKYSYAECSHFCEQHHLEFSQICQQLYLQLDHNSNSVKSALSN